jgi:hypothetical protein
MLDRVFKQFVQDQRQIVASGIAKSAPSAPEEFHYRLERGQIGSKGQGDPIRVG